MSNSAKHLALKAPKHGGCLQALSQIYDRPVEDWLDLSSGINPNQYPVGQCSQSAWSRLPYQGESLSSAATAYYGCHSLLMVPGSQWAIEVLPLVISDVLKFPSLQTDGGVVLVPRSGYAEHAYHWQQAGYTLSFYSDLPTAEQRKICDVCIVINPNNPTGYSAALDTLLELHKELNARGALLLVDEAFIDSSPQQSMLTQGVLPNLIVLRSFGKFFGLAGARVGSVFGSPVLLSAMAERLPLWSISGPSMEAAERAFLDKAWQADARSLLALDTARLAKLLMENFGRKSVGCELFQTIYLDDAPSVFDQLCRAGVAVRLLDNKAGLRFGLPAHESDGWGRLESALGHCVRESIQRDLATGQSSESAKSAQLEVICGTE